MAFIKRDGQGNIVGEFARPQVGISNSQMRDDHPELVAFRNRTPVVMPVDVDAELEQSQVLDALLTVLARRFAVTKASLIAEIKVIVF